MTAKKALFIWLTSTLLIVAIGIALFAASDISALVIGYIALATSLFLSVTVLTMFFFSERQRQSLYPQLAKLSISASELITALSEQSLSTWIISDINGNCRVISSNAKDIFDVQVQQLLDTHISTLFSEQITSRNSNLKVVIDQFATAEITDYRGEHLALFPNAEQHWVQLHAVPIPNHADFILWQLISIDDTKLLSLSLAANVRDLNEINTQLEEYAYIAAHDLKSPIAAISNISQWLRDDLGPDIKPEIDELLRLLGTRTDRAISLIDGLLRYASLSQADATRLECSLPELVRSIEGSLDTSQFVINTSDVVLTIEKTPLEFVLRNLIDNAVKHHDKSTGTINIELSYTDDLYLFSVSDDGPGIPEEHHHHVVQMFKTLKPKDEVEGSGLGLAQSKKLVHQFGGTFDIFSDGIRGTTIVFSWRRYPSSESTV